MRRLMVLRQQIRPKVPVELPPNRVDVVGLVLSVVVLEQEARALYAVVVTLARGASRPGEMDSRSTFSRPMIVVSFE